MKKSTISAKQKQRRPGRPATGVDPMIGLRAGKKLTAAIDHWAKANGLTRSEAIRQLVERALSAEKPEK
jgi:hypothetical protein